MTEETKRRIEALARDRNVDLEDLGHALRAALADGTLSPEEQAELHEELAHFEPAAARYLEDVIAGRARAAPNRVLLAPHPAGAQKDLYYARTDVVALQDALGKLGLAATVDGDYGKGTAARVGDFQAAAGLPRTGEVDSATLLALNERLAAQGAPPLDFTPRARIRPDVVVTLRGAGDPAHNRALEEGLARLSDHLGMPRLPLGGTGVFDADTELAVKRFQRFAYLPETGLVDVATLNALNAALELAGLPCVPIEVPAGGAGFRGQVELHFYPGPEELKVYVLKNGKLLDRYGMVGGSDAARPDPNNPHITFDPTPAGRYEVELVNPHTSQVWAYSYVPYGAELREVDGEIQFRDGGGQWRWATGPKSVFAGRNPAPLPREAYLEPDGRVLATWTLSDFGHLRARLKSLATGAVVAHMIHATPQNEQTERYFQETAPLVNPGAAAMEIGYSHGCEHIHPKDLDEMIARGYLAPGTRFVVHGYDEVFQGAS